MCGIAGFAGFQMTQDNAERKVRAMCDAIRHRGPDEDGYLVADGIALGMRRLSVIDVGGGKQPIYNEDGTVVVVFNGEIYNHHALRHELEKGGHKFRTRSDTEVLVHLYEEYGTGMVSRLHGMFAFSIWDLKAKTLFMARDRTGMKPLSYWVQPEGIAFCSELRSLWAMQSELLRISPAAVMQYLAFGYVPDPSSIFEGVRKLPPGHQLLWNARSGLKIQPYWKAPRPQHPSISEAEIVDTLRVKLDQAVAAHLEAEVPLGAFLSGGLDSSTVVALMSKHASGRVRTFSIGFDEAKYDESAAARAVATELNTSHTELILKPGVEDTFETIAALFDEPFADSSAIPTFQVAQLARQSVTVALSGDGGDELFGGYTRYSQMLRDSKGDAGIPGRLLAALGLMLPHFFPGRNRMVDKGRTRWGRYATTVLLPLRVDEGGVALKNQPGGRLRVADHLVDRVNRELGDDFAAAMMQLDLETYLPGDILTKVDRTSMAVSLEARVPLLDFNLVDFALSIPGTMRMSASENKRLFRRAIKGLVPDFVLSRPKQGFEIPLGRWFRGPLRHRINALREPSSSLQQFVDKGAVRRLVFEHSVGRRDHSAILWRLIVLECWLTMLGSGRLGHPPVVPKLVLQ